jgi:hypothetical protein
MTVRKIVLGALAALFASSAAAAEWSYEDGSVPIAWIDNGRAQLQFACRGGDFTVGFWARAPHREVAGAAAMSLAIAPDPAAGSRPADLAGASFAQDLPLIHSDGTSMIIRGPVAKQWASIAQKAKGNIRVAYIRKHGEIEVFDANDFGAAGSAAAIKRVLDRCG